MKRTFLSAVLVLVAATTVLGQRFLPQQGGYRGFPPQRGGYRGFPPQHGGYRGFPPQRGGFPPQQGGFPPQQGGFPPQQGGFPPQQGGSAGGGDGFPLQQGGGEEDCGNPMSSCYGSGDSSGAISGWGEEDDDDDDYPMDSGYGGYGEEKDDDDDDGKTKKSKKGKKKKKKKGKKKKKKKKGKKKKKKKKGKKKKRRKLRGSVFPSSGGGRRLFIRRSGRRLTWDEYDQCRTRCMAGKPRMFNTWTTWSRVCDGQCDYLIKRKPSFDHMEDEDDFEDESVVY